MAIWGFGVAKKRYILVVEDDADVRTMLGMHLADAGWAVAEAANGQQGVDVALARPPDVILMDFHMPVMGGPVALLLLRRNALTAKTPVLMMSARGALDDVEACLEAGANDFVEKPIDYARLLGKLDKLAPPPA